MTIGNLLNLIIYIVREMVFDFLSEDDLELKDETEYFKFQSTLQKKPKL